MANSLIRRISTHRNAVSGTHTGHYAIHRLLYFEYFRYVRSAIASEKDLKHWTREQKIKLKERTNPTWEDLFPAIWERHIHGGGEADSLRELQTRKARANAKEGALGGGANWAKTQQFWLYPVEMQSLPNK